MARCFSHRTGRISAAPSGGREPKAVQRSHDANAREHRRAAVRRHQDQDLHRRLPLRRHMLGLRELRNIGPGVLEGD